MRVIPVLGRLKWEDCDFEYNLGYTARCCPKDNSKNRANCASPSVMKNSFYTWLSGTKYLPRVLIIVSPRAQQLAGRITSYTIYFYCLLTLNLLYSASRVRLMHLCFIHHNNPCPSESLIVSGPETYKLASARVCESLKKDPRPKQYANTKNIYSEEIASTQGSIIHTKMTTTTQDKGMHALLARNWGILSPVS